MGRLDGGGSLPFRARHYTNGGHVYTNDDHEGRPMDTSEAGALLDKLESMGEQGSPAWQDAWEAFCDAYDREKGAEFFWPSP